MGIILSSVRQRIPEDKAGRYSEEMVMQASASKNAPKTVPEKEAAVIVDSRPGLGTVTLPEAPPEAPTKSPPSPEPQRPPAPAKEPDENPFKPPAGVPAPEPKA
jgi:hypothetical protein